MALTHREIEESAIDHDRACQQQADGDSKCEASFQKTRHLVVKTVTWRSGSQRKLGEIRKIVSGRGWKKS
jgi:hypothetical protein